MLALVFSTMPAPAVFAAPSIPKPVAIDSASCAYVSVPSTVKPGQNFKATVTMRNTGTTTWTTSAPYFLSYFAGVAPNETPLPRKQVKPKETVTFAFSTAAPQTTGTYSFSANMIRVSTGFGGQCLTKFTVVAPPQCSDKIDNDGDGNIDWPADRGCKNPSDNNEGDGLADLALSMTAPTAITRGNNLIYTVTIKNLGPDAITNPAWFYISPQPSMPYMPELSSAHCSTEAGGQDVFCRDILLKKGETTEYRIAFDSSQLGGTLLVEAFAEGGNAKQGDPNLKNNTARLKTNVTAPVVSNATLNIAIDGPAGQTFTRDQHDAMLANIVLTTDASLLNVRRLYVAIQGNTANGSTLAAYTPNGTTSDDIAEVLENVMLRNATTGRTVQAVRLTGSNDFGTNKGSTVGTYQIYRFDDFTIDAGPSNWQLKADFIDNGAAVSPRNGDQFKTHICAEGSMRNGLANVNGCPFGGLIVSNTGYQAVAQDLDSLPVKEVTPGGTVTGNTHRIADATLDIVVKALASTGTAVKNAKNITLMRFEARAGEGAAVLLTRGTFEATDGATALQNGTNYSLWFDTDNDGTVDTILDSGKAAVSGKVIFDTITNGGLVISKEQTVTLEVHADIAGSLSANSLQLRFATADANYIESEKVSNGSSLVGISTDGVCAVASCDITVTTTASTVWTLVSQGSLFVTKSETLRSRQLLGGALGDSILNLKLRAVNEPVDVTALVLSPRGGSPTSVDRLELWKRGATAPFAMASANNCGSADVPLGSFCASMQSQQLVVPRNDEVVVLVRPRLKSDEAGAVSGEFIQLFVDGNNAMNNATGTGSVRARGVDSSNNLSGNDSDATDDGEVFIGVSAPAANTPITGEQNVTVLSKITSIVNADPNPNGTPVPTGIASVGQFKISAAPNMNTKNGLNTVLLEQVAFTVSTTNVLIDPFSLNIYNKADPTQKSGCSANRSGDVAINEPFSGNFFIACGGLANEPIDTAIEQGTDATFVLEMNILNPKIDAAQSSVLQVSLDNFSSPTLTPFNFPVGSHFEWGDTESALPYPMTPSYLWVEYPDTQVNSTSYQS